MIENALWFIGGAIFGAIMLMLIVTFMYTYNKIKEEQK